MAEKKTGEGVILQEIHLNNIMVTRVVMEKGAQIPLHSHLHEQITIVVRGKLKFNLNGTERILKEGEGVKIPSNTPHFAIAVEECECYDSWSPIREDYIIDQ